MSLQLIRAIVSPEHSSAVEEAINDVFEELAQTQPSGLGYASTRADDGVTYLILLDIEDPTHNPLPNLDAFQRFQAQLPQCLAGPPAIDQLTVIGNYRVF
jgi:quinol monooxygenase YgiN